MSNWLHNINLRKEILSLFVCVFVMIHKIKQKNKVHHRQLPYTIMPEYTTLQLPPSTTPMKHHNKIKEDELNRNLNKPQYQSLHNQGTNHIFQTYNNLRMIETPRTLIKPHPSLHLDTAREVFVRRIVHPPSDHDRE